MYRIIDSRPIAAAVRIGRVHGRLGVIGVIVGFFELQLGRAVRHIYRVVFGRFEDAFGRSVPLPGVPAARDELIRLLGVNADRGKVQLAVQRDDLPFGEIYVLAEQIGIVLPNDQDILYGHLAVVPYAAAVTCGTVRLRVEQACYLQIALVGDTAAVGRGFVPIEQIPVPAEDRGTVFINIHTCAAGALIIAHGRAGRGQRALIQTDAAAGEFRRVAGDDAVRQGDVSLRAAGPDRAAVGFRFIVPYVAIRQRRSAVVGN